MMKWLNVSRSDLEDAVATIKHSYEPDAARNLVEYFHERMSTGASYDKEILHKLMSLVFARMVDGDTADQAFGLKQKRGKYQRECTVERDTTAAICMILLMRKGATWLESIGYTANLLFPDGAGDKVVERAYQEYREAYKDCPEEVLLEIIEPYTLPS